jgi:hypothetical protein
LGVCLVRPWKVHPSVVSACDLQLSSVPCLPASGLANGFASTSLMSIRRFARLGIPKLGLARGAIAPFEGGPSSGWVTLVGQ